MKALIEELRFSVAEEEGPLMAAAKELKKLLRPFGPTEPENKYGRVGFRLKKEQFVDKPAKILKQNGWKLVKSREQMTPNALAEYLTWEKDRIQVELGGPNVLAGKSWVSVGVQRA